MLTAEITISEHKNGVPNCSVLFRQRHPYGAPAISANNSACAAGAAARNGTFFP